MIPINEAQKLITENLLSLEMETISLKEAGGRFLAEDVLAPIDHPIFDQTAVDGYALRFADLRRMRQSQGQSQGQEREQEQGKEIWLEVIDEVKAGDNPELKVVAGQVARIFTGGAVPEGADTVVMQEFVERKGNLIQVGDPGLKLGGNIRKKGEQIREGGLALTKGTDLNAAAIGFLGTLGYREVRVSRLPRISVTVTGSEFAESMEDLKLGKIFESNGVMMQQTLKRMGIEASAEICVDDADTTTRMLEKAAAENDIVLVTGGVSVGDYDFTKPSLEAIGFETVFWKINQKPGKPMLFAKRGNKAAFGLPGNPRSALVCFYEYVWPFIRASMGARRPFLPKVEMPLVHDFRKKEGRAQFLTARFVQGGVEVTGGQGSHMMQSFAESDALIELPEEEGFVSKGELVRVHILNV